MSRRNDRLPGLARLRNDLFLQDGHFLDRDFDAEIAPGHHDPVRSLQDLIEMLQGIRSFDLGDNERLFAENPGGFAHGFNIGRAFHKRLADRVHSVFKRKFKACAVMIRKRTDPEIDPRKIQTLPGTEFSAYHHFAMNVLP